MATDLLRPTRGGFLRPFGCAIFIRDFLWGRGTYGSKKINPDTGAPQADICYQYKMALIRATAVDRATRREERLAKRDKRPINPDNIDKLTERYLARLPYKSTSCRYHSFVVYFAMLQKLGWVEPTGFEETSSFQENYPPGPARRYFRLTKAGRKAPDTAWINPQFTLYGY